MGVYPCYGQLPIHLLVLHSGYLSQERINRVNGQEVIPNKNVEVK